MARVEIFQHNDFYYLNSKTFYVLLFAEKCFKMQQTRFNLIHFEMKWLRCHFQDCDWSVVTKPWSH